MPEKQKSSETEFPNSRTVELNQGSITYSLIGEANPYHHPIIWISGAEQSRINPFDAAKLIAQNGRRQVLIYDQPIYNQDVPASARKNPEQAISFLAEGVLAAAEDAGIIGEDKVVDVVAHSLGGLVAERVKQLAGSRGLNSFEQDHGSRYVLAAPTGSNRRESTLKIAGRWVPYMLKSVIEGKTFDPGGAKGAAMQKNVMADLSKAQGEVKAMAKHRIDYKKFGEALVLVYPEDRMFPENGPAKRYRQRKFMNNPINRGFVNESMSQELPLGFATPIGYEKIANKGIKRLLTKASMRTGRRRDYVESYRGAGHNDPTDNPERTVAAILQYLDSPSTPIAS